MESADGLKVVLTLPYTPKGSVLCKYQNQFNSNFKFYRIEGLYETGSDIYNASPRNLLVDAVSRNDEIGSCTCCIVTLDKEAAVI
jgi:hypothetical protein